MHFFVGSANPVKLNAVKYSSQDHWPDAQIVGFEVKSQVADQPLTDEETQAGAINRAKAALAAGLEKHPEAKQEEHLGVGLEGGVTEWNGELWSTVWVAVVDSQGKIYTSNGARVKLPERIAELLRQGQEMGPAVSQLVGASDIGKKEGMFGVISGNYVTRAEEYGAIAKFAIGLWYGRDWDAQLK
jgi:inosine/xanthosine triphosphatase